MSTALKGPGILPRVAPRLAIDTEELQHWTRTNVRAQRQTGWSVVTVTTQLGDLTAAQMRILGELADSYGDGGVRVTSDQDLLFGWVPTSQVRSLYRRLLATGLGCPGAGTLADVTSCPGAESCKLAVTQSRGLGRLLLDQLEARPDLTDRVPGLNIKISGCPNGCGQHHMAGLGFQGNLRKIGGRPAPHYFVMVGGGTGEGFTTFGRHVATIPARRGAEAVERLIGLYREQATAGESALQFFRRAEPSVVKGALAGIESLTLESASPEDFVDLAEDTSVRSGGSGRGVQRIAGAGGRDVGCGIRDPDPEAHT